MWKNKRVPGARGTSQNYGLFFKRFYTTSNENLSPAYKKEYKLTQEQIKSLIGILIADGSLEKGKPSWNTRLSIDYSYPLQEAYVKSLYALWKPLRARPPVTIERKPDKTTGNIYKSICFKTLTFACLNEFHSLFYSNNLKRLPLNIKELLTPLGLAHIIMGDGYYDSLSNSFFMYGNYTLNEVKFW